MRDTAAARTAAGLVSLLLLGAVPAQAQVAESRPQDLPQIGGDSGAGPLPQIGTRTRDVTGAPAPRGNPASPRQLSRPADSRAPGTQLTREGPAAPAPRQLSNAPRTAEAAPPLSRPAEGRTAAVAPVRGNNDRCDPAAAAAGSRACAAVIENRSAEFTPPAPAPLSPEQRLLADQRARERSGTVASAARRLANGDVDPDSFEQQMVAAAATRGEGTPPPAEAPAAEPALSQETIAIINAIVAGTTPTPPQ